MLGFCYNLIFKKKKNLKMTTHQEARVNPYRYGVLEGNHVEDRYGLDLVHQNVEFNFFNKKFFFEFFETFFKILKKNLILMLRSLNIKSLILL